MSRYEVVQIHNRFTGEPDRMWCIWDTEKREPLVVSFETESEAVAQCEAAQAERQEQETPQRNTFNTAPAERE